MRRLSIADPCAAPWEQMEGSARTRRCAACDREVHDLSARTEAQAAALLLVLGSRGLCVRFEHDAEGAVRFVPERRGEPSSLPRAAAGLLAAASMGAAACSPAISLPPEPPPAAVVAGSAADPASPPVAAPEPTAIAAAPADADNDGVQDSEDACPRAPGPPSADPAKNGCPVGLVVVTQGELRILERIQFAHGARAVDARSRRIIEEVATVLNQHPDIGELAVKGHASSDEPRAAKLGESRAAAVVALLVALGVDPARLVPRSLGLDQPIDSNATREGRARNRRVEFEILSTASCSPPSAGAAGAAVPGPSRR